MSGLLNKALTNGTTQLVATVPESAARSLVDIMVVNPTASEVTVQAYITNQVQPTTIDLIDFAAKLEANGGRVEYNCVNCSAGEKIFINAPAGLVVRVTNIDEA